VLVPEEEAMFFPHHHSVIDHPELPFGEIWDDFGGYRRQGIEVEVDVPPRFLAPEESMLHSQQQRHSLQLEPSSLISSTSHLEVPPSLMPSFYNSNSSTTNAPQLRRAPPPRPCSTSEGKKLVFLSKMVLNEVQEKPVTTGTSIALKIINIYSD